MPHLRALKTAPQAFGVAKTKNTAYHQVSRETSST
jgi:hypothetical protein